MVDKKIVSSHTNNQLGPPLALTHPRLSSAFPIDELHRYNQNLVETLHNKNAFMSHSRNENCCITFFYCSFTKVLIVESNRSKTDSNSQSGLINNPFIQKVGQKLSILRLAAIAK